MKNSESFSVSYWIMKIEMERDVNYFLWLVHQIEAGKLSIKVYKND